MIIKKLIINNRLDKSPEVGASKINLSLINDYW